LAFSSTKGAAVRICVIGKFPPIQGGVSAQTYWTAHRLAARGHEVHVVTNAKEAALPLRIYMRAQDWQRCEAAYGSGSVKVHWTDPIDASQAYIPVASAFVTKLAAIATRLHAAQPFDVIYSHYMEPYGIAGHLAAQATGAPHVVRMAGSDAGRLWLHPQFEALYDHVLRRAEVVIAAGAVAERAIERGVDSGRVASGGPHDLPNDLFTPDGPSLDLDLVRAEAKSDPELRDQLWGGFAADRAYFGIYGKLGESKGSFALLDAMARLRRDGIDVGLVALAHGGREIETRFRQRAGQLEFADRILQMPFLPHWRVPEFLRSCLAVCCLEQDFPIRFHSPMVPREVLLCGTCLVSSAELIKKLPRHERLPSGYGCVAIEDVNEIAQLSERLASIAQSPHLAAVVGARGCRFARELQQNVDSAGTLQPILEAAAARRPMASRSRAPINDVEAEPGGAGFRLTRLVATAIGYMPEDGAESAGAGSPRSKIDLARARKVLDEVQRNIADGKLHLRPHALAVEVEIVIAEAERAIDRAVPVKGFDPLFRLRTRRWALDELELAGLVPIRDQRVQILQFDYDVSPFLEVQTVEEFPTRVPQSASHVIAFRQSAHEHREPLIVDRTTARVLELSDGSRTAGEIVATLNGDGTTPGSEDSLKWIEHLFVVGLVRLEDAPIDTAVV
jgi:glycosyltransferase involved in cell wall biosynthesis